jgi:hypothetical protein
MIAPTPMQIGLDRWCQPGHALSMRFVERTGRDRPFGVTLTTDTLLSPEVLLPEDATVVSAWRSTQGIDLLAEADGYLIHIDADAWQTIIRIAGSDAPTANTVAEHIRAVIDGVAEPAGGKLTVWCASHSGGRPTRHRVKTIQWEQIARNYPTRVQQRIAELVLRGNPTLDEGRLILFHGEAGTGKTTAVRALMEAWSPWCDTHVVADPDNMFSHASYLLEVLATNEQAPNAAARRSAHPARWKLRVAEDADDYLRSSARRDAGAALGRLLNTTDGLLAQAARVIVLLTTNEPLGRLHPAITRPGRCLAAVEFTPFGADEGRTWLSGTHLPVPIRATLAELYQLQRTGMKPVPTLSTGNYL